MNSVVEIENEFFSKNFSWMIDFSAFDIVSPYEVRTSSNSSSVMRPFGKVFLTWKRSMVPSRCLFLSSASFMSSCERGLSYCLRIASESYAFSFRILCRFRIKISCSMS